MRTIHDLEAAFEDLADTAPDAVSLTVPDVATPSRRRAARRVLLPVAAVATIAAVAVAVAANSGSSSHPAAGPSSPSVVESSGTSAPGTLHPIAATGRYETPDLTFRFTADAPRDGLLRSRHIGAAGQSLTYLDRSTASCGTGAKQFTCHEVGSVTLNAASLPRGSDIVAFDPDRIEHREAVRVNGRPGFFGQDPIGFDDRTHLYWQYADGAWADAVATNRAAMLALAESVRPATETLSVPVRVARDDDKQYIDSISVGDSGRGGIFRVATPDEQPLDYFVIWGDEVTQGARAGAGERGETTVDGRTWQLSRADGAEALLKNSDVPLEIEDNDGTTVPDIKQLLPSIRVASDLADTGTWFAADDLLR